MSGGLDLVAEFFAEVLAEEFSSGLGAGLLGGDVGVGEVGPDGDEGGAGEEEKGGGAQLLWGRGKVPHHSYNCIFCFEKIKWNF